MSELKRNLKVLKSEQVRRAELKERITETISAKTGGMESHGVEQNPTMDEEKENHLDSTDRTTTESLADEKVETSTTTVAETKSKCLVMLPGTVVGLKTSSENLTRKDIKVREKETTCTLNSFPLAMHMGTGPTQFDSINGNIENPNNTLQNEYECKYNT